MVFSLSRNKESNFPTSVRSADGNAYRIRPDIQTILTIYRLISDDTVISVHKPLLIQRLFFIDKPPSDWLDLFRHFIGSEGEAGEPQYDLEFDAEEIYSDFIKYYNIDLMEQNIHFGKFKILLSNLPADSSFRRKIELRFADTSKLKGTDRAKMEEAKAKVQLPVRLTREERKAQEDFEREWGCL